MDSTFVSEMMGTGLLILLGDGVVAAVLLNKSKAQNSGWIVITFGWAIAVMIGVFAAYYAHWGETEDPGLKLAVFSTGPAIRNTLANLITEIIGTFVLVFGVYAIFKVGGDPTGSLSAGLGPVLVAFLVLGIGLSLGGPTGYAINPARDLGPRIIHAILPIPGKGSSDWSYSWIPVVGPLIGGALGGILGAAAFGHFG
jgi:glycerol uptake facilitator protein